jgi:hypothetical protein
MNIVDTFANFTMKPTVQPKRKVAKHPPRKVFDIPRTPMAQRIIKGKVEKRVREYDELKEGLQRLNTQIAQHHAQHGQHHPVLLHRRDLVNDRIEKVTNSAIWWRSHYLMGL